MIATAVFSTILVAITMGVIHFSAQYYKGVYGSETQNVARDISDQIANAVKFGAGELTTIPVTGASADGTDIAFCAGGYIFQTKLGQQYTGGSSTGFYIEPQTGSGCNSGDTSKRKQLLAKNMRVAGLHFYETSQPGVYSLSLTIAYGDDDLLSAKTDEGGAVHCNSGFGSEYCAVSSLVTTVEKRI